MVRLFFFVIRPFSLVNNIMYILEGEMLFVPNICGILCQYTLITIGWDVWHKSSGIHTASNDRWEYVVMISHKYYIQIRFCARPTDGWLHIFLILMTIKFIFIFMGELYWSPLIFSIITIDTPYLQNYFHKSLNFMKTSRDLPYY